MIHNIVYFVICPINGESRIARRMRSAPLAPQRVADCSYGWNKTAVLSGGPLLRLEVLRLVVARRVSLSSVL